MSDDGDEAHADDDLVLHDDLGVDPGGPPGPRSAGDTLGGTPAPTGNDGTMGQDAPSGDAGLGNPDLGASALPDGADAPGDLFGDSDEEPSR